MIFSPISNAKRYLLVILTAIYTWIALVEQVHGQSRDLNYCLDQDGIYVQLNCSNPLAIGRGPDNYCVDENQTAVSCCKPSRCLVKDKCLDITNASYCYKSETSQECVAMDSQTFVGREAQTRICLKINSTGLNGVERCIEGPFCISGGVCIRLSSQEQLKAFGRETNSGRCINRDQLPDAQQLDNQLRTIAKCVSGFCIEKDSLSGAHRCVKLNSSFPDRIQKDPQTHMCLAANTPVQSTQYIECASGFVSIPFVNTTSSSSQQCSQQYQCIDKNLIKNRINDSCWYTMEGQFDVGYQFSLLDSLFSSCLEEGSSGSEDENIQYGEGNKKECLRVEKDLSMIRMVGRNTQGRCIQLNETTTQDSQTCFYKDVCIYTNTSKQCVIVGKPNNLIIGKNSIDQSCFLQNDLILVNNLAYCAQGYCYNQSTCVKLSNTPGYYGRESQTYNCLDINTQPQIGYFIEDCTTGDYCINITLNAVINMTGDYLAKNRQGICKLSSDSDLTYCSGEYCLDEQSSKCRLMSIDDSKYIGGEAQTTFCLPEGSKLNAMKCALKTHCLNVSTDPLINNTCQQMNSSNNLCGDINNECKSNTTCKYCPLSTYLSGAGDGCIKLSQTECINQNDTNQAYSGISCKSCPEDHCLVGMTCYNMEQYPFTEEEKNNNNICLIQQYPQRDCLKVNMDSTKMMYDSKTNFRCAMKSNKCVNVTQNLCYRCPNNTYNPGDNNCYERVLNQEIANNENFYFGLLLNRIRTDLVPNSISDICMNGCWKCKNVDSCLQCLQGYFLFFDITTEKDICVPCPESSQWLGGYWYEKYYNYKLSLKCGSCYNNSEQWDHPSEGILGCTTYYITYNNLQCAQTIQQQIQFKILAPPTSANFSSIMFGGGAAGNICPENCAYCYVDNNFIKKCRQCDKRYALFYTGVCVPCISGCSECFFGGRNENDELINYSENPDLLPENLNISQCSGNNNGQYSLLCKQCTEPGTTISINRTFCEPCGTNCSECYYGSRTLNYTSSDKLPDPSKITNIGNGSISIPNGNDTQIIGQKCMRCKMMNLFQSEKDCALIIDQNCNISAYFSGITHEPYTIHPWWNESQQGSYQSCLLCNNGYNFVQSGTGKQGTCQPMSSNITECLAQNQGKCYSCDKQLVITQAGECKLDQIFINTVQHNLNCSESLEFCLECFDYRLNGITNPRQLYSIVNNVIENNTQDYTIHQCLRCQIGYLPTPHGCQPCSDGCDICYQGRDDFNFTANLILTRPLLNFTERMNYVQVFMIQMKCTQCRKGYSLGDKGVCFLVECGPLCDECIYNPVLKTSECMSCSSQTNGKIEQLIKPIVNYIKNIYQVQDTFQTMDMLSFNSIKQDCVVCPYGCNGCDNPSFSAALANAEANSDSEATSNSFDVFTVYDAKCYDCKSELSRWYLYEGDVITNQLTPLKFILRYDRERMKCVLCEKDEHGCVYSKKTELQVHCRNEEDYIGDGTADNPLNFQRAEDIDWDTEIMREYDKQKGFVVYNELAVQQVELVLRFNLSTSKVDYGYPRCNLKLGKTIASELRSHVKSLKVLKLVMEPLDAVNTQVDLELNDIIEISGFTHVEIRNFNVSMAEQYIDQFGFVLSNIAEINHINFSNVQFQRKTPNDGLSRSDTNKLVLKFRNAFDIINFNNVDLSDFMFLNQSLFQTEYTVSNYQSRSISISISDLTISDTEFNSSEIFAMRLNVTNFTMRNWNLTNVKFVESSMLLRDRTSAEQGAMHFQMHDISIIQGYFLLESSILRTTMALSYKASNLIIKDSVFNTTLLSIIAANLLHLENLTIVNSQFYNASFFQNTDQVTLEDDLQQQQDSDSSSSTTFSRIICNLSNAFFEGNTFDGQQDVILSLHGQSMSRDEVYISSFLIKQNTFTNLMTTQPTAINVNNMNILNISTIEIVNNQALHLLLITSVDSVNMSSVVCNSTDVQTQVKTCISMLNFATYFNVFGLTLTNLNLVTPALLLKQSQSLNYGAYSYFKDVLLENNYITILEPFNSVAAVLIQSVEGISFTMERIQIKHNIIYSEELKIYGRTSAGFLIDSIQSTVDITNFTALNSTAYSSFTSFGAIVNSLKLRMGSFSLANYNGFQDISVNTITQGGFLYAKSQIFEVYNCTFSQGRANKGGALFWDALSYAVGTIHDCTFNDVSVSFVSGYSNGGAIFVETENAEIFKMVLSNCNFDSIFAGNQGGLLYIAPLREDAEIQLLHLSVRDVFAPIGSLTTQMMQNIDSVTTTYILTDVNFTISYSAAQRAISSSIQSFLDTQTHAIIDLTGVQNVQVRGCNFHQYYDGPADPNEQLSFQTRRLYFQSFFFVEDSRTFTMLYSYLGDSLLTSAMLSVNTITALFESVTFQNSTVLSRNEENLYLPNSVIQIYSKQLSLYFATIIELHCAACDLGTLFAETYYFFIYNTQFINNSANNGGALYLTNNAQYAEATTTSSTEDNSTNVTTNCSTTNSTTTTNCSRMRLIENVVEMRLKVIQETVFINNSAGSFGGAIYLHDADLVLRDTTITKNKAALKGGGIYVEQENVDEFADHRLYLKSTNITQNTGGEFGGGIYLNNQQISYEDTRSNITRNYANINDNVNRFPRFMKVMFNGSEVKNNSLFIQHVSGSLAEYNFTVQLLYDTGEEVNWLEHNDTLNITALNLTNDLVAARPDIIPFNYSNNMYNISDVIFFGNATTGHNATARIILNTTAIYIQDWQDGVLVNMSQSYKFYFQINFRNCYQGEENHTLEAPYITCSWCGEGQYSLINGTKCQECPVQENDEGQKCCRCWKNQIRLNPGFWKPSTNSANVAVCNNQPENCIGNMINKNQTDLMDWNVNQYCIKGNVGALCEDCDIDGVVWDQRYYHASKFDCAPCTQQEINAIKLVGLFIAMMILMAYMVYITLQFAETSICSDYLKYFGRYTAGRQIEVGKQKAVYYKVLINYFQIITVLFTFDLRPPGALRDMTLNIANPFEYLTFAQDCYIRTFQMDFHFIYFRIIWSHISLIIFVGLFLLSYITFQKATGVSIKLQVIYCSLNYIFICNIPGISNLIIGTMGCKTISGIEYVKDHTRVECDDEHSLFTKMMLVPLVLVWAGILPIAQFVVLYRNRFKLKNISIRFSMGLMYNEYSARCYFWEVVKIYQKILIIVFLNYYDDQVKLKGSFIFITILIYMILSKLFGPYERKFLNRIDLLSSNACAFSILCGMLLHKEKQDVYLYIGYATLIGLNAFLLFVLLSNYISLYLVAAENFLNSVKKSIVTNIPFAKYCIRYRKLSQEEVMFLWGEVKSRVTNFVQNRTSEKQMFDEFLKQHAKELQSKNFAKDGKLKFDGEDNSINQTEEFNSNDTSQTKVKIDEEEIQKNMLWNKNPLYLYMQDSPEKVSKTFKNKQMVQLEMQNKKIVEEKEEAAGGGLGGAKEFATKQIAQDQKQQQKQQIGLSPDLKTKATEQSKDGESPDELLEQEAQDKALIKKEKNTQGPSMLKKNAFNDVLSKVSQLNNDIYKGMIKENEQQIKMEENKVNLDWQHKINYDLNKDEEILDPVLKARKNDQTIELLKIQIKQLKTAVKDFKDNADILQELQVMDNMIKEKIIIFRNTKEEEGLSLFLFTIKSQLEDLVKKNKLEKYVQEQKTTKLQKKIVKKK